MLPHQWVTHILSIYIINYSAFVVNNYWQYIPTQMIHFVDGERHKFIEVQILDDAIPEGDETFQLILANPSAGLQLGENTTGLRCWETLNIHDRPWSVQYNFSLNVFSQLPWLFWPMTMAMESYPSITVNISCWGSPPLCQVWGRVWPTSTSYETLLRVYLVQWRSSSQSLMSMDPCTLMISLLPLALWYLRMESDSRYSIKRSYWAKIILWNS